MNIAGVVSFLGAWEFLSSKHQRELDELITGLTNYISGNVEIAADSDRRPYREYFEKSLYDLGWSLNDQTFYTESGRRVPIRFIGPVKNGVAAQISSPHPDFLSRWLFTHSTLAVRYGLAEVPILLVPMKDEHSEEQRSSFSNRMNSFEYYSDQLEMLSPLSVNHPFLILGYSSQGSFLEPIVLELRGSDQTKPHSPDPIIDRSIEFPPEYQQAGIGILNYFASYLKEQYPNEKATVRIEQSGLNVRMVVESEAGNKEIIEKALHEYELIISGQERADKFTDSEKLILELRNELRIAKFRLESQQDIIALQNLNQNKSETQIEGLMALLGQGLKSNGENHINIQVNPCIQNSVAMEINQDVSLALGNIEELIEYLPKDTEALLPLRDLEQSLISIEAEKDEKKVRRSAAMSKFRRVIEQLSDANSAIKKAIDAAEQGYDVAKKLAGNYNKIASWCGLPTIPTVFTNQT
jgi:hypothetical protein